MSKWKFSKPNRKVFTFVKWPDFKLEPMAQQILNCIFRYEPINRFTLLHKLDQVITSKRGVSDVLSFHQRQFLLHGLIRVESPREYQDRKASEEEKRADIFIERNNIGGWGIKLPNSSTVIGNYATKQDARRIVRENHYDEKDKEDFKRPEEILRRA